MIKPKALPDGSGEAGRLYSFGLQLLRSGSFNEASNEFKRFRYYYPQHEFSGEAAYAAAWAKFKAGQYDEAAAQFRSVYMSGQGEDIKARALFLMAESDYRNEDYESAIEIYEMVVRGFGGSYLGQRAAFMMGWSYMKMGRWEDASERFSTISPTGPFGDAAGHLSNETLQGSELERKTPLIAGILSAYLPGAGQFYVGRKRDALVSFLINEGFIVGAIASFYSGNIFLGVTLIAFETGWYSGNIYSGLNGAYKFNRRTREDFVAILHLKYGLK